MYKEYQESRAIHDRMRYQAKNRDWRDQGEIKTSVHDQLGGKLAYHDQLDTEDAANIWEEDQWGPSGLMQSQKRRVQCLKCKEIARTKCQHELCLEEQRSRR